jgi:ABC-type transport system substrate-binding protein
MTSPLIAAVPTDFSMESRSIARLLCNGLVDTRLAPVGGSRGVVPAIAAALPAVSPDFRTFTFTIRAGLHYSDGSPVVASDVRATFLRVLDPAAQFGPRFVDYYDAIEGAVAYKLAKASSISGIVVAGNTVTFRLVRSDPSFPEALALPFVCISPGGSSHADGTIAAGTGPYRVLTQAGGKLVLGRNPAWLGPAGNAALLGGSSLTATHWNLDQIEISTGLQPAVQAQQIASGALDISLDGDGVGPSYPVTGVAMLRLNTRRGPLRNVRLRRAIAIGLDKRPLGRVGTQRRGTWTSLLPPQMRTAGRAPDFEVAARLRTARRLVNAATGTHPIRIRVLVRRDRQEFGRELARQLRRLGFTPVVRRVDDPVRTLAGAPGAWDVAQEGWQTDRSDRLTFVRELLATNGAGNVAFSNRTVDAELARISRTAVGKTRDSRVERLAQTTLRTLVPVIPYRVAQFQTTTTPRVRGLSVDPWDGIRLADIWVAP